MSNFRATANGISRSELQMMAREATAEYFATGTPLTDAVVKAASLFGKPLTDEHVRRVCEMTYHDAFERHFGDVQGHDRYVSFSPPDAVEASRRLEAHKAASYSPRRRAGMLAADAQEKVASSETIRVRRYSPANAFEEMLGEGSDKEATAPLLANPYEELQSLRNTIKEASDEISARLSGLNMEERLLSHDLYMLVKQASSAGATAGEILAACASGMTDDTPEKVASALIEDVVGTLNYYGRQIYGELPGLEVNTNHPLPVTFGKVASLRRERAHLEYALEDLKTSLEQVDREIVALCS